MPFQFLWISNLEKFTVLFGTRRFITVFGRVRHWTLSWTSSVQSTPSSRSFLRCFLILFSHLCIGVLSGLRFPDWNYVEISHLFHLFFLSPHLIFLDLNTVIILGAECKLWSSSVCISLSLLLFCYPLCLHILLSTLFPNIANLFSSLRIRDQIWQYETPVGFWLVTCVLVH
jgi:hypothetical protein